jgi:hypothetical protein
MVMHLSYKSLYCYSEKYALLVYVLLFNKDHHHNNKFRHVNGDGYYVSPFVDQVGMVLISKEWLRFVCRLKNPWTTIFLVERLHKSCLRGLESLTQYQHKWAHEKYRY